LSVGITVRSLSHATRHGGGHARKKSFTVQEKSLADDAVTFASHSLVGGRY
jgi:hypothetical protein